jgi:NAD(P)-dependent dehydrogenase (short-subunit alcohol dehydrogenase family)
VVINDIGVELDGTGEVLSTPADEVVAEIKKKGGKAVPSYDSVAEYESAGRIIKTCVDSFGRIDILVNNAGHYISGRCYDTTPEDWDGLIKAHLYGTFFCSRHACEYMREQKWGRIISVTSNAYYGIPNSAAYSAAKGGIVTLMRCMALDLAGEGITSNCICPGALTRFITSVRDYFKGRMEAGLMSKEAYSRYERMSETPGPEFVAPVVVYLASDYGSNINGAVLGVMGGRISIDRVAGPSRGIYKDFRKDGPWTIEEMRRVIPKTIEPYCPPLKAPEPDYG